MPVTIKSAIEVEGLRCETGSPSRLGIVAAADAVVVARLRSAGAVILGTTNVAEMLMDYETVNPLHGRTLNPWDPARTPGGSSGGESAAIAAGCSAGGIGSDGGGSIRVPAHFTGICGLKPTPGRIPTTGHQPPCLGPFSLVGVVGPMARTVADLDLFYRMVAGWDAVDPLATPLAAGAALDEGDTDDDWRVGWFDTHPEVPVSRDTADAVRAAVAGLEAQGVVTEPWSPAILARATDLWHVFFCEVGEQVLAATLGAAARDLPILAAYAAGVADRPPLTAARLTEAWIARDLARADSPPRDAAPPCAGLSGDVDAGVPSRRAALGRGRRQRRLSRGDALHALGQCARPACRRRAGRAEPPTGFRSACRSWAGHSRRRVSSRWRSGSRRPAAGTRRRRT